ncbi:MAG: acyltransferase family protein, partial [Bacteroidota bacterium]
STIEGFTSFLPSFTIHLWFLYYLFLISLSCFLLGILLKNQSTFKKRINQVFHKLFTPTYAKIFALAVCVFVGLLIIWELTPPTPLDWVPEIEAFLFYLFFYLFGWLLYTSKYDLQLFTKNAWLYNGIAVLLFFTEIIMQEQLSDVVMGIFNAFIIALLIFGITGIFVQYYSQASKRLRYISDGSYWVYLIHLPFTILIPGYLAGLPLAAIFKFLITLIITTVICFSSYHFLVRKTFIGQFLNGKKYK